MSYARGGPDAVPIAIMLTITSSGTCDSEKMTIRGALSSDDIFVVHELVFWSVNAAADARSLIDSTPDGVVPSNEVLVLLTRRISTTRAKTYIQPKADPSTIKSAARSLPSSCIIHKIMRSSRSYAM